MDFWADFEHILSYNMIILSYYIYKWVENDCGPVLNPTDSSLLLRLALHIVLSETLFKRFNFSVHKTV